MNVLIVLSAVIATSCAFPTSASVKPDPDIINDLQQFDQCIDTQKFRDDIIDAFHNDPYVIAVVLYLMSDDFKPNVEALDKEPTYLAILTDLEKQGVPAYETVNEILKGFNITPINQLTQMQAYHHNNVGTFDTLFDKLISDISEECTKRVFEERQAKDPKFKALVDHLHSGEYNQLVEAFKASETLKRTLQAFNKVGLNLAKYVELLKKLYHYDW